MSLKEVERQLKLIEQRLSSLEDLLGRQMRAAGETAMPSGSQDAVSLADAVSKLLLSVQDAVMKSFQKTPALHDDDLADRFAELDKVLMGIFKQMDTGRPH